MITRAIQRNVAVSASKATLCCRLIRNKPLNQALKILEHQPQKTAKYLFKLVLSAASNAVNNHAMDEKNLYIFESAANQARTLKRTFIRAKGRADLRRRRFSHLVVVLSDNPNERKELNQYILKPRAHQWIYKKLVKQSSPVEIKPKIILEKAQIQQGKYGPKG